MDFTSDDIVTYKKYLNTIDQVLNKYFEEQKEYICCKQGCSHCCERGEYPYSQIEYTFLIMGLLTLELAKQQEIIIRIKNLKKEYETRDKNKSFSHRCPFLGTDNNCMVYDYRGVICRTFGLLTEHSSGKYSLPFCHSLGLNYSKVYNTETKKIDYEAVKNLGYKNLPTPYRTNLKTLMSPEMFVGNPLNFGEIKPLIEWL